MVKESDIPADIKGRKPRYWMIAAAFALLFAAVLLLAVAGTYLAGNMETMIKTAVLEKIEDFARQFKVTFKTFEKTISGKKDKKRRNYDSRPIVETYRMVDFEGKAPKHWVQFNDASKGSFIRKGGNGNHFMALKVDALKPDRSGYYYVNGMTDLGVRLKTAKLKGVYFSVRSSEFAGFTFFFWSWVNGQWRYNVARNLKAGPDWQRIEIPFSDFKSKSDNRGPVDMITTAGWGVSHFNAKPGAKGALHIDNFGFFEKAP